MGVFTNKLGLPEAIVNAVVNDPYSSEGSDISATTLIRPPQQVAMQKKYDGQVVEDVADRLWALFGTIGHLIIERSKTSDIQELRLFHEVEDWTLSGQLDYYEIKTRRIMDFKFTSVWSVIFPKPEWEQQLNVMAYLCRHNGIMVDELAICALLRDWQQSKAQFERDKGYPQVQVQIVPVELWSPEEQAAYIVERIKLHQDAQENGVYPECTPEERWQKQDKFAVKKGTNKRALRVLNTVDDAQDFIDNHKDGDKLSIEERPGESLRCKRYCSVSKFCKQYKG